MFLRTVTIELAEGQETELYAFWEWASAIVREQPGYIRGLLVREVSDPRTFVELHYWQREEDSLAYRNSERFREVIKRLQALSRRPPVSAGFSIERESAGSAEEAG